jgi:uncharacterized protein (DUF983 family)
MDNTQAVLKTDPEQAQEPRFGSICPQCGVGKLDYDGLLNLACGECGYTLSGCFT